MSLLSTEGPSVLIVVAVPVLLVMLPLTVRGATAIRRSRIAIVALLAVLVILGAMSIGVFFVPTLIAMTVSMSVQTPRKRTQHPGCVHDLERALRTRCSQKDPSRQNP